MPFQNTTECNDFKIIFYNYCNRLQKLSTDKIVGSKLAIHSHFSSTLVLRKLAISRGREQTQNN